MIKEICFQRVSRGKIHSTEGPNGCPCLEDADKPDL